VPGRQRGRGSYQRDLLRAKGPGFSSRARKSSFSMLTAYAAMRFGELALLRIVITLPQPGVDPGEPACRNLNFHTGTASRRDKSSTGSPWISRSTRPACAKGSPLTGRQLLRQPQQPHRFLQPLHPSAASRGSRRAPQQTLAIKPFEFELSSDALHLHRSMATLCRSGIISHSWCRCTSG
jgi:hypothetical protein